MSGIGDAEALQRILARAMSERELQDNVIELAERLGLLVYHTYDSRRSQKGFPDLVIVGPEEVLFIELKREAGKLSPEQVRWGAALARSRGIARYGVWKPADWLRGDIEGWLRELSTN